MQDDSGGHDQLSRRTWLSAVMGVGASALAGCSGGGSTPTGGDGGGPTNGDGETSASSASTETVAKQTAMDEGVEARDPNFNWVVKSDFNPVEGNFNPQSPNSNSEWFFNRIWGDLTIQANLQGMPITFMADSFEVADDGSSATLTLGEAYQWWDGTPVRPKDLLTTRTYTNFTQHYQETHPDNPAEVLQEQPAKIRFNYRCPTNPDLALLNQRNSLNFPRYEFYEPWFERYRDASSESAIESVTKEFNEESLSLQTVVDEGYGCGLWKPADWDTQRIVHEKVDDHPRADNTNLQQFTIDLLGSNQKITQAISNGEVDAGNVGAISGTSVPNRNMEVVHSVPTGAQIGLKLNKANPHLAKPRVRRALAYAINYEDITTALDSGLGVNAMTVRTQNMTSRQMENNYLPDGALEQMIDYGSTAKLDEATRLMEAAGYTKEDGTWTDEEGRSVNLTHITPPWNKYKFISDYLSNKLGEFGIQTKVQSLSYSGLMNKWQNTFEFDVMTWFQSGLHPAVWYSLGRNGKGWQELRGWGLNMLANPGESADSCEPRPLEISGGKEVDDRLGQPIRPEYPAEVGTETLDLSQVSETNTLEPFVLNDSMRRTTSREELEDLAAEFAWYANWAVPNLELFDEVFTHYGNTEKFVFPNPDQDVYHLRNHWQWMLHGAVDGAGN
ncbi:ABC transporter substrate-binding protein [Halosimplex sp. TS25]|uniref:ABC transporter substrate-binding protein n=1 Tax=Halosimplex rarum TaxID=3396619 RepID=UPI0039E9F479